MRFPAIYAIAVGLLMLAQWGFFLLTGQVPEVSTAPREFAFHLAAEGSTALLLIVAGTALLRRAFWGKKLYLVAAGMLVYTVINSPGYFAQQGAWPLVAMFAMLLALAAVSIIMVIRRGEE